MAEIPSSKSAFYVIARAFRPKQSRRSIASNRFNFSSLLRLRYAITKTPATCQNSHITEILAIKPEVARHCEGFSPEASDIKQASESTQMAKLQNTKTRKITCHCRRKLNILLRQLTLSTSTVHNTHKTPPSEYHAHPKMNSPKALLHIAILPCHLKMHTVIDCWNHDPLLP